MGLADRGGLKAKKTRESKKKESRDVDKTGQKEKSHDENMLLDTTIDLIYQTVLEKKSADLKSLAEKFQLTHAKMEKWAKMLDNQGLLELYYPIVGGAVLRVKQSETAVLKNKKLEFLKNKKKLAVFAASIAAVFVLMIFLLRFYDYI